MTSKDDNDMPVLYGVSHLDGRTPIRIRFTPSRGIKIDTSTSITFNPTIIVTQNSLTNYPLATGTSSADNNTVLPWVVNATTGAVLVTQ